MRVIVVGHGERYLDKGFGSVIDGYDVVVRLKGALTDPKHRGVKTDVICSRDVRHRKPGVKFWFYPTGPECVDAERYWTQYAPRLQSKASTGTSAVMVAAHVFKPDEIALIGFDKVLHPEVKGSHDSRWGNMNKWGHSSECEQKALSGLGVRIIDLYEELTRAGVH